ncbi:MAG: L-allo-threonine aldolase [Clostridiales bacterium 38_11]|nr:MAG: L-allo-threonine aldolase [Clostridiales bacterium 38_11]HBH12516.1 low-specificity L-threonine aldolase [Clostridiales bacterium]
MRYIDLRSDTVTKPTPEMRLAMSVTEVGDDVYGDDATVNRLESLAALMTGKETAMFVPSGTMGNQIAIMTHTNRGDEIIAGVNSHIVHYEAGAPAVLSGVNYALVNNLDNKIYADDVERLIRPDNVHFPKTSLLCLENALTDGTVVPLHILQDSYAMAKKYNVSTHLDGARLFNAAVSLGADAKDIADCCDSVMFCISKGLCSPIGSMLCGSTEFIKRARYNRKILGGGMRQAGVLAACGIISLEKMVSRLHEDHDNALYMAKELNKLDGINVNLEKVQINMVFFRIGTPFFDVNRFVDYMHGSGVKMTGIRVNEFRFVTNNDVSRQDIDYVVSVIKKYIEL